MLISAFIAFCLVALMACGSPENYSRVGTELNIDDTLTAVFCEKDAVLVPQRQLMVLLRGDTAVGWCYWEQWHVQWGDEDRGTWIMAMDHPTLFQCDSQSARDSLAPWYPQLFETPNQEVSVESGS